MRATTALIRIGASGIALALTLAATPALARHKHRMDYPAYPYPGSYAPPVQAAFPVDRALAERCGLYAGSIRSHLMPLGYHHGRHRRRDHGLGGALLGGAAGGLIGNRLAGRGDRTIGTVAGAAVGAIAGAAIDRAEDGRGHGEHEAPYAVPGDASQCAALLPPGYMLVSVPGGHACRDEIVTREEWVPEYETIPGHTTIIERAPPRDKRTKLRRVK